MADKYQWSVGMKVTTDGLSPMRIDRLTATQVITDNGQRWTRDGGYCVPRQTKGYMSVRLRPWTAEDQEAVDRVKLRRALADAANRPGATSAQLRAALAALTAEPDVRAAEGEVMGDEKRHSGDPLADLEKAEAKIDHLRAEIARLGTVCCESAESYNRALDRQREQIDALSLDGSRLRAENAALRAEREWRPIETAPKDGTEILLAFDEPLVGMNRGRVAQASLTKMGDWSVPYFRRDPPTHWMPLPAPPGGEG